MNSITSEKQNFQCTLCLDNNAQNPTTTVYGHCHPNTEIGNCAQWIHGICQRCFIENDIPPDTCKTCNLKPCDTRRITLNSDGIVTAITSHFPEIQNKIFIKEAESLGNLLGRTAALVATLVVTDTARRVVAEAAATGVVAEELIIASVAGDIAARVAAAALIVVAIKGESLGEAPEEDIGEAIRLGTFVGAGTVGVTLAIREALEGKENYVGVAAFGAAGLGSTLVQNAISRGGSAGGTIGRIAGHTILNWDERLIRAGIIPDTTNENWIE